MMLFISARGFENVPCPGRAGEIEALCARATTPAGCGVERLPLTWPPTKALAAVAVLSLLTIVLLTMATRSASCSEMPPPRETRHVVDDDVVEDVHREPVVLVAGGEHVLSIDEAQRDAAAVTGSGIVALDAIAQDLHASPTRR